LVAANYLCGQPLGQEALLEVAASLEGHPDNVAPALLGGCRIVVRDGGRLVTAGVPLRRRLWAVVFIPDMPMPTQEARAVLPSQVRREEAVYNLGRVALLVNALATGRVDDLGVATQDALHQPARQRLFPAMERIIQAALGAGALGAFLSGGGSSVVALTQEREMTIGYEMADVAEKSGVTGTFRVLRPTLRGCYVVSAA
jgi:homoserine kinase